MNAKQNQLKREYEADPDSAILQLFAKGDVDFEHLSFRIHHPSMNGDMGLHPASGGDGSFECPVEIMLAGWIGCFGVTLSAVARSMRLSIRACQITASGLMDFKGTLAVDRSSPVGLTELKLVVEISSQEPEPSIEKLIELTKRYCVVHQTLDSPPPMEVILKWVATEGNDL